MSNEDYVYFKATGRAKKVIDAWNENSRLGEKKLTETMEPYGKVTGYRGSSSGIYIVWFKKAPDIKLWRMDGGGWTPRKMNPEGKKIAAILDEISIPTAFELRLDLCSNPPVSGFSLTWIGDQPYIRVHENAAEVWGEVEGLRRIKDSTFFKAKEKHAAHE